MPSSSEPKMPPGIASAKTRAEFSSTPLLDAFENFQGSFFDLDRGERIFAGELKTLRTQLRTQMLSHGFAEGDRAVLALPNGPLFACAWASCLEAGVSPVIVHGETPELELDGIAEHAAARFFLTEAHAGEEHLKSGAVLLAAGGRGRIRLRVARDLPSGWSAPLLPAMPLHPTSGTTGAPKIAMRPGGCAVAEPIHYIETLGLEKSDSILCVLPMSHAYAYGMCFLVTLLASAELLFTKRFHPALTQRTLEELRISVFPAAPALLELLLGASDSAPSGRPRILLSAGAPLARGTFQAYQKRHGQGIRQLYGTTETGGISIASGADFDAGVGPPMKGVEVSLRNCEQTGQSPSAGILRVRSSSMMAGYLEDGHPGSAGLEDGWFETGDLARIDSSGRILLQGRQSEVINVFGYKVIPQEVEGVIAMLPQVVEVKVYAGRHWLGFDVVQAAIVCREPLDEEKVLDHCERHLVSYKCPSVVRFVDSLPHTSSGKVAVSQLPS
jgi:long-chain acyl-CoA synthetase